jgi:hypothetical protein
MPDGSPSSIQWRCAPQKKDGGDGYFSNLLVAGRQERFQESTTNAEERSRRVEEWKNDDRIENGNRIKNGA